jgi:hypothetical protein
MATEDAKSGTSCRAGAVASGVALLLALIMVQCYALGMRRVLISQYERLDVALPHGTIALIVKYPGVLGNVAILAGAAWLAGTFFVRRGTVVVVINSALLLAVVLFMMMHGLAAVLPFGQLGVP